MSNDEVIRFLMFTSAAVLQLHRNSDKTGPPLQSEPDFRSGAWEVFDEGFCRWMGWRGEAEQEREIRNVRHQAE